MRKSETLRRRKRYENSRPDKKDDRILRSSRILLRLSFLRAYLHETSHPGTETTPVFCHFLVTLYMVWRGDEFIQG